MPRPKIPRIICAQPAERCFKPNGRPMQLCEKIWLEVDEFEALRLVDLVGLQQQEAARAMGVSRQTLANMLKRARHKVADCLMRGKALMMGAAETGEEADASSA